MHWNALFNEKKKSLHTKENTYFNDHTRKHNVKKKKQQQQAKTSKQFEMHFDNLIFQGKDSTRD